MSSSLLLKIAGTMLAMTPIGHVKMFNEVISPGLRSLGDRAPAAYASKVSWNQANGYFVIAALLLYRWSSTGVQPGLDTYTFLAMMATHLGAGGAYVKKGIYPPALVYWGSSLLMGISTLTKN